MQILFLLLAFAALGFGQRKPVPPSQYAGWGAYHGGPENLHYSTLGQITPANVSRLQKAWTFHLKPANLPADARLRRWLSIELWAAEAMARHGIVPADAAERLAKACSDAGGAAVPAEPNPVDTIWAGRPAAPSAAPCSAARGATRSSSASPPATSPTRSSPSADPGPGGTTRRSCRHVLGG